MKFLIITIILLHIYVDVDMCIYSLHSTYVHVLYVRIHKHIRMLQIITICVKLFQKFRYFLLKLKKS